MSIWAVLLYAAWLGSACSPSLNVAQEAAVNEPDQEVSTSPSGASLPDTVSGPPEAAGPWLIDAERRAANQRDLDQLALLWAPESRVIDRRGYAAREKHYIWEGKEAVLNRYVVAVFPHAPPLLEPGALDDIEITGKHAGDAYRNGDTVEIVNGDDWWQLIRLESRWWLLELSYSSH